MMNPTAYDRKLRILEAKVAKAEKAHVSRKEALSKATKGCRDAEALVVQRAADADMAKRNVEFCEENLTVWNCSHSRGDEGACVVEDASPSPDAPLAEYERPAYG